MPQIQDPEGKKEVDARKAKEKDGVFFPLAPFMHEIDSLPDEVERKKLIDTYTSGGKKTGGQGLKKSSNKSANKSGKK